jgi:predicted SnoaL-like aldol condensation-catalyzing enzyme
MSASHKQSAVAFLESVASGQVQEAYQRYIGPGFKHHNPYFPGDAASLMEAMEENARKNSGKIFEVKTAIAEGDQVRCFLESARSRTTGGAPWFTSFVLRADALWSSGTLGRPFPRRASMRTACSRAAPNHSLLER